MLDQIPGIGPSIRTNLLKSLGSARRVRAASVAELAAVPKVTPKLAQRIHEFFHPEPEQADLGRRRRRRERGRRTEPCITRGSLLNMRGN